MAATYISLTFVSIIKEHRQSSEVSLKQNICRKHLYKYTQGHIWILTLNLFPSNAENNRWTLRGSRLWKEEHLKDVFFNGPRKHMNQGVQRHLRSRFFVFLLLFFFFFRKKHNYQIKILKTTFSIFQNIWACKYFSIHKMSPTLL